MIAYFHGKTFAINSQKLYTFTGMSLSSSLATEKQDAFGQKPSTYIKDAGLDQLKFTIPLNVEFGIHPRKEYEAWIAIKDSKTPDVFLLGGKPLGENRYLLTSVTVNNIIMNVYGDWISCDLQLQLDEFVRPGAAKGTGGGSASETGNALGIEVSNPYAFQGYTPEEKAKYKRKSGTEIAEFSPDS